MTRMALPPLYGDILALARAVFRKNLEAVVIYGQAARPYDYSPYGDVNVAIITRREVTPQEKMMFYSYMERHVVPVFITLDQLRALAEKGDMFAHAILRGSLVLMDRGGLSELAAKPSNWGEMKRQIRRKALAALGVAAQNLWRGAYWEAVNYMYRSLRACLQWYCATKDVDPPYSDSELSKAAREAGVPKSSVDLLEKLRRLRMAGLDRKECVAAMRETLKEVKSLLGLGGADWDDIRARVGERTIAAFEAYEESGTLRWRIQVVTESGGLEEVEA